MPKTPQRGFVMVTMLCCLVVLVAFLGLAIDTGYLKLVTTRMQTAADAAALGGVQEPKMNGGANVAASARGDAALNAYAPIAFHNAATVTLSAPSSGNLAGILMFQDRSVVSAAVNTFRGATNNVLNGSLYFPTTPVSYSGGTNLAGSYSIIVAKTITLSGGCKMHNDYSSLPAGSPVRGNAVISE